MLKTLVVPIVDVVAVAVIHISSNFDADLVSYHLLEKRYGVNVHECGIVCVPASPASVHLKPLIINYLAPDPLKTRRACDVVVSPRHPCDGLGPIREGCCFQFVDYLIDLIHLLPCLLVLE
jgi:hypothetical protein